MYLGIDLGTGSVKASLLDGGLQAVSEASRRYTNAAPRPGWAEIDPEQWWQATVEAVRECVGDRGRDVAAIGLSGQSHGLVLVDDNGEAVRPAMLWYDGRSHAEVETLRALPAALRERLGNPLVTGMTAANLLWVRNHEPEVLQRATHALCAKDWLRLRLTGDIAMEPADASTTLLYDVVEDGWAMPVMRELGLPEALLPPLVPSAARAGELKAPAASALGLTPGLPVAAGAADAAASLLGLGLTRPGQTVLQVGTGMQIMAVSEETFAEPDPRCNTFRTAGKAWFHVAAMQNGGTALQWAMESLACDQDELYALAFEQAERDADVLFLPYVTGERTPLLDPHAAGAWTGLRVGNGRAEMARAVFEGIAFSVKDGWNALRDRIDAGDGLLLTGGGTADPRWRQLLADTLETPLAVSPTPASAGRGAALLGAVAAGYVESVEDLPGPEAPTEEVRPNPSETLRRKFARFRETYRALRGVQRAATESP